MLFFAIHNKALSDKICVELLLVECPIESCYVCGSFQLNFLAKKSSWRAVVGRDDQKLFTRKSIKQV